MGALLSPCGFVEFDRNFLRGIAWPVGDMVGEEGAELFYRRPETGSG